MSGFDTRTVGATLALEIGERAARWWAVVGEYRDGPFRWPEDPTERAAHNAHHHHAWFTDRPSR